jgi:hypothetical protein
VIHKWAYAGAEGILGALWTTDTMKVALMKTTWVPTPDAAMSFSALQAANEITGTGYTAGGLVLASKVAAYDSAADRTNLQAADSTWGPGATFTAGFAAVYDDSHASKLIWSYVDFEGAKAVDNGVFTIDWAALALLYVLPAA